MIHSASKPRGLGVVAPFAGVLAVLAVSLLVRSALASEEESGAAAAEPAAPVAVAGYVLR